MFLFLKDKDKLIVFAVFEKIDTKQCLEFENLAKINYKILTKFFGAINEEKKSN